MLFLLCHFALCLSVLLMPFDACVFAGLDVQVMFVLFSLEVWMMNQGSFG